MTSTNEIRDRAALRRDQMLDDYAAISRKRRGAAEATALRMRSRDYLDVLAVTASRGLKDWSEVRELLRSGQIESAGLDPMALSELGRVLLLQNIYEEDVPLGVSALRQGVVNLPLSARSRRYRKLLVEHEVLYGSTDRATEMLDRWPDVDREFFGYLRGELMNPFIDHHGHDFNAWLASFNRPFVDANLVPVILDGDAAEPFDRLAVARRHQAIAESGDIAGDDRGPLVSVILTAYDPDPAELRNSVLSIMNQSLSDLELIVVDDCSGAESRQFIESLPLLDDRIRLTRTAENVGTYEARNLGIAMARGEFVTGQDDDDWSHPERLYEQVAFLRANEHAIGCRVASITCLPNLSRVRLGYPPLSLNASSLMMTREAFLYSGGFLRARKAADTELHRRMERLTGRRVIDIMKPLTIVRVASDSLSRSEFGAGWSHPARRSFKSAYASWHASAATSELRLRGVDAPRVNIPLRFRVEQTCDNAKFDVVIAGDWRQYGGPQKSMIEEISALVAAGRRVGVLHLEAARFMSKTTRSLNDSVQSLINSGVVEEVSYDDPVEVDLFILRYPPILQFAIEQKSALLIRRMIILANQAPSELDGSDIRYLVDDCTRNSVKMFSVAPLWVPQGPQVRAALAPYLSSDLLSGFDIPGILNPEEWYVSRRHRRSMLPVVGRHSRDNAMKWPDEKSVIELVYPISGRIDVRIMGGASAALRVLGETTTPAGWTVFETDAMPVRDFLASIDYFVFFQHPVAVEAFGRAVLEAIASGAVTILPPHYEPVFGVAAIYADPQSVEWVISRYQADPELYRAQVERARIAVTERFSYESYIRLIDGLLAEARA